VLPCEPRGKRPLGRLVVHGLNQATTDPATIEKWWKAEPEANIGLVTGIKFDALDVDGPEGWASLARIVDSSNGCLPSGPVSITPGGGAHYLYAPTGKGNRAGLAVHLDWRGSGGYILAAPSIHPSGGLYEWVIGPDEAPLKPAPASLIELLTKPASSVLTIAQRLERPSDAYGRRALEAEVGRVVMAPVGVRNDALNRAAHSLGQLVGGGSLDLPTVIPALERAGLGAGLEYQEVRATIKSGLGAGMLSPRRVPR
jgi:hypothetical protein